MGPEGLAFQKSIWLPPPVKMMVTNFSMQILTLGLPQQLKELPAKIFVITRNHFRINSELIYFCIIYYQKKNWLGNSFLNTMISELLRKVNEIFQCKVLFERNKILSSFWLVVITVHHYISIVRDCLHIRFLFIQNIISSILMVNSLYTCLFFGYIALMIKILTNMNT